MPARKAVQGLKGHPMEQKIVEALMAGESPRQIASWVRPPVTHVTVWRYMQNVVRPIMENADRLKSILPDHLQPSFNASGRTVKENNGVSGDIGVEPQPKPQVKRPVTDFSEEVKQDTIQAITAVPALHIRENRIKAKTDRWRRVQMIVDGRAKEMSLCARCQKPQDIHPWEDDTNHSRRCDEFVPIPGGESGFLARDFKGAGENIQEVYKFDDALFKSFSEIEKEVAIELGQWQENTGGGQVAIQIVCPAPGSNEMPKVTFAQNETLMIEGECEDAAGIEEIGLVQK